MNQIAINLLKISIRLEQMGLKDDASELALLADAVAKDDRLLTVAEAAAWIGCGRRTLDQMISDRRIPAHLIGGRYRFDKSEVLKETKLSY
jgi:excisionase family DNA binding protein